MRRPIIHLVVALLTFAVGTILGLLFQGSHTSLTESARRPTAAARTELRGVLGTVGEPSAERCGCAESVEMADSTELPASTRSNSLIYGGVLNGHATSLPQPLYPAIAKAARASGNVIVDVVIDETGCVESARAVNGHPLLQSAAVKAVCRARFVPTRLQGQPVKVKGRIMYNFVLE